MQAARLAVIRTGEDAALRIELDGERVATALGKDLEVAAHGMITPDGLAEELHALDVRRAGAAVRAVKPAVRPPRERVRAAVRVFEAEAGELHLGRAVGDVVTVLVRVEEEIRRVQHPHAAATGDDTARNVQVGDEVLGLVEDAVAVGVLEDGDAVLALEVVRRRRRNLVVNGAEVLIILRDLETGGERVLEILHDPHPATVIEVDIQRLADHRLGGGEVPAEAGGDLELRERLGGRGLRGTVLKHPTAFEALHELGHLGREARVRRRVSGVKGNGDGESSEGKQAHNVQRVRSS